jgi:hypothetical protein
MGELELEKCLDVIDSMATSKFDVNLTPEDAVTQLKLIVGSTRYDDIVGKWKAANQGLLQLHGTKKYSHKATGKLYDGLDSDDDPSDYQEVWI